MRDLLAGNAPAGQALLDEPPVVVRGLFGVAFGTLALGWASAPVEHSVLGFCAYAGADGVAAVTAGLSHRPRSLLWMLEGACGVVIAAFIVIKAPALETVVALIGFWAVSKGLVELVAAATLEQRAAAGPLTGAAVSSLLLGAVLLVWPAAVTASLALLVGAYALFFGLAMLLLALRLRRASER